MEKYVNELFDFIKACPTPYHAVEQIKYILNNFKYEELKENEDWNLKKGGKYYVIRDNASLITFKVPNSFDNGFNIVCSHLDSPCFKLKPDYHMVEPNYERLNTEGYGGMLKSTWFDKPLGIAGRVMVRSNEGVVERLINLSAHNVIIPSLAPHLQKGGAIDINMQNDLLPVIGLPDTKKTIDDQIAKLVLFEEGEEVLSHDLFLYNKEEPSVIGMENEMIASPKLDDLECVFSSLEAYLEASNSNIFNVCAIFDNEEVGSSSNHGAKSTFLTDTLERICLALNLNKYKLYANSMLVSADNAHAVHPAHPEKSDPTNKCFMNQGIVIKYHSGLAYTTEAVSSSIFKAILDNNNIPHQEYTNRSDMLGGSTLGHLQLEKLSIVSVDIGLAQLAMHSSYETAGAKDIYYMVQGLKSFYETNLVFDGKNIILK